MNSTMTSAKFSTESSSYDEYSFLARSRASSFSNNNDVSPIFMQQHFNNSKLSLSSHFDEEEELEAPVNIYHEHRGRLEEDKKARTDLDIDILNNDLYCPVQQNEINNKKSTSRGLNIGKFASLLPRFSFSTNNNYNESTNNDTWDYYHNDLFNTNSIFSNFDGINGINSVACK